MGRDEIFRWFNLQLGLKETSLYSYDGATIQRAEWIAVAVTLGDWTLDDIKEAIDATSNIKSIPRRVDEIYRLLDRKRWMKVAKLQEGGKTQ